MSQVKFHFYTSKKRLESDIEQNIRTNNDVVFVSDQNNGNFIWTHGAYIKLTESEFKNFFDLYSANDILMGSYLVADTFESISGEDTINTAISKLDKGLSEIQSTIGDINVFLEKVLYDKE